MTLKLDQADLYVNMKKKKLYLQFKLSSLGLVDIYTQKILLIVI